MDPITLDGSALTGVSKSLLGYYDGDTEPATGSSVASRRGTKENALCSNRGLCDTATVSEHAREASRGGGWRLTREGVCVCVSRAGHLHVLQQLRDERRARRDRDARRLRGSVHDHHQLPRRHHVQRARGVQRQPDVHVQLRRGCVRRRVRVCARERALTPPAMAGWTGGDCAERTCPHGKAWFDQPSATDTAHARVECSNMGICDRTSGLCVCRPGFEGAACERSEWRRRLRAGAGAR